MDPNDDPTLFPAMVPDPPHSLPLLPADVVANVARLRPEQVDAGHWATLTGLAHEVLRLRLENARLRRRVLALVRAEPKPN